MLVKTKRIISALLSAFVTLSAVSCVSGFAAESEEWVEMSDSRSYHFDVKDATVIQRYCAYMEELTEAKSTLYDVNFDGFVTVTDASLIQMHTAGLVNINSDEYQSYRDNGPVEPTFENTTAQQSTEITEEVTEEETTEEVTEPLTTEEVTEEVTEPRTTEEVTEELTEPLTTEEVTEQPVTTEPATEASEDINASYLSFDEKLVYMGINETYFIGMSTDAAEVTYTSSDESVAVISDSGMIIPHKTGIITVTCSAANGLHDECVVYIGLEAEALIMNTPSLVVGLGEGFDLNSFVVGNGHFAANRFFYSTDESVVDVDYRTGEFTAVGLGKAKVVCKLINGVTAKCEVEVKELSPTVRLNVSSVTAGVGEMLGFVSYAEDGKAVISKEYYSENENIAVIGRTNGLMTGVSAGKTRIYCQLQNGFRAYADITVKPAPKTVTLNATKCNIKVGDVIRLKEFFNDGSYNTPYTLEWTSSNKAVSIESRSGYLVTLKAKALGTAVITAKTYNGVTAKCTVTVSGSNIKCVDVSSWQGGNIDFNKLKASGINYVIIRAGFKTTADNQFVNNYNKARAAGLKIGSYWYMCAENLSEAKAEAQACIKVLGGRKLDLPFYYDVEDPYSLKINSQATLTNMSVAFCDALKAKGYKAGIYASGSVFAHNNKLNTDLFRQKGYSIWDAEWASSNSVACDVWQYSDNGYVGGINGNVDMNYIYNLYIEG